jgi:hypothetical protein
MPRVPIRQRLLRNVAQYAHRLQFWRFEKRRRREADADGYNKAFSPSANEDDSADDDDISLSSISTGSSLSSINDSDSGYAADDGDELYDEERDDIEAYFKQLETLRERTEYLTSTRVLFPHAVSKREQLTLVLNEYKYDDIPRFRRNLRVTPDTFDALLEHIENHEVFTGGNGAAEQTPVEHQLAIALFRFGHFGNASSVESIAQWAGTSAGTVVNATRRVMIAFLSLHDQAIRWPTDAEKEEAKRWVEEQSCAAWRDGWLLVDGTLVPLADKLGHHGEAYFDRKSNYSLNVQVRNRAIVRVSL